MGGATGGIEEIEVVVVRDEDEDDGAGARPAGRGAARRRSLQVLVAALLLVGTQLGPVVAERPVERAAAPRPRPVDAGHCPDPAGRRLWCSFIDDPACCEVTGADLVPGAPAQRSRAA